MYLPCIQEARMINSKVLMFRDRIGHVFSSSLNNSKRGVAIVVCKKLNLHHKTIQWWWEHCLFGDISDSYSKTSQDQLPGNQIRCHRYALGFLSFYTAPGTQFFSFFPVFVFARIRESLSQRDLIVVSLVQSYKSYVVHLYLKSRHIFVAAKHFLKIFEALTANL